MKLREFLKSLFARRETSETSVAKALSKQADAQNALASLLKSSKKYQVDLDQWLKIIEEHPKQIDAIFASFGKPTRFFGLLTDKRHIGYQLTQNGMWETLLNKFDEPVNSYNPIAQRALMDKMLQFDATSLEKWQTIQAVKLSARKQQQQELARLPQQVQTTKQQQLAKKAKHELDAKLKYLRNKNEAHGAVQAVITNPVEYKLAQQRLQPLDLARTINQPSSTMQKFQVTWLSLPDTVTTKVNYLINKLLRRDKYQAGVKKLAGEKHNVTYDQVRGRLHALDLAHVQRPSIGRAMAKAPLAHLDLARDSVANLSTIKPELPVAVESKLNKLLQTPTKKVAQITLAISVTPLSANSDDLKSLKEVASNAERDESVTVMSTPSSPNSSVALMEVAASEAFSEDGVTNSNISDFAQLDSDLEDVGQEKVSQTKRFEEKFNDPRFDELERRYLNGELDEDIDYYSDDEFTTPVKPKQRVDFSGKGSLTKSSPLLDLDTVSASPLSDNSISTPQEVGISPSSNQLVTPIKQQVSAGADTPCYTLQSLYPVCLESASSNSDSYSFELASVAVTPNSVKTVASSSATDNSLSTNRHKLHKTKSLEDVSRRLSFGDEDKLKETIQECTP
jgi:hypothetical protein